MNDETENLRANSESYQRAHPSSSRVNEAGPLTGVGGERLPGASAQRLTRLMRDAVERMRLDLDGAVVLTEAATGAYAVTPILAALAGAAEVIAVTKDTRYGTVDEVREQTQCLAGAAGIGDRINVTSEPVARFMARADVITNSGHLRPLGRSLVEMMKPTAVVPLMFESWELQLGRVDIDIAALNERGIAYAGTNERHPEVDVFSYLGIMAVKLLHDAGIPVYKTRVFLLCDNPFSPFIKAGLEGGGASVIAMPSLGRTSEFRPDVVLVAMSPRPIPVLTDQDVMDLAQKWPDALVVQYWGDLDRPRLATANLTVWPPTPPALGHMAVLPSDIGPDPVVRLQAGGLKVASILRTPAARRTASDLEYLDDY